MNQAEISKYPFAAVLGSGIEMVRGFARPGAESERRLIAGVQFAFRRELGKPSTNRLLFCGGATLKGVRITEAEVMRVAARNLIARERPDLLDWLELREENESIDIAENLKKTKKICVANGWDHIALITEESTGHLENALQVANNIGLRVTGYSSESLLIERDPEFYQRFFEEYIKTDEFQARKELEDTRRTILRYDPTGRLLTLLSKYPDVKAVLQRLAGRSRKSAQ